MALIDQSNLALDATFRERVRMATIFAAQQIQSEVTNASYPGMTTKRTNLSNRVLTSNGSSHLDAFSYAVAAFNGGSITAQSTDSDIQNAVNSIWNDMAGITQSDQGQ